ncbi:hypothetical protein BGAL_0042g00090 [Botrytis galanthina]|uniref:Uncharacterized protein n=1 Tax=Botrytis galanthina TaxID=278940 RepID=A0A4S8RJF9_9HELO|nr:hypothetical protein BGAL_0042g00090 [Botrytis galanthina]
MTSMHDYNSEMNEDKMSVTVEAERSYMSEDSMEFSGGIIPSCFGIKAVMNNIKHMTGSITMIVTHGISHVAAKLSGKYLQPAWLA